MFNSAAARWKHTVSITVEFAIYNLILCTSEKRRSDDSISSQKENELRMALVSVKSISSKEIEAIEPEIKT